MGKGAALLPTKRSGDESEESISCKWQSIPTRVGNSPRAVFSRNLQHGFHGHPKRTIALQNISEHKKSSSFFSGRKHCAHIYFDMTDDDVNACRKLPIATLSLICWLPNGFVLLRYKIMQLQDNMSNCTLTCPFGSTSL